MANGIFSLLVILALAAASLCLLSAGISIIRQAFSARLYCPKCGHRLSDNNSSLEDEPENICNQCHQDLGSRNPFRFWQIGRLAAIIRNNFGSA